MKEKTHLGNRLLSVLLTFLMLLSLLPSAALAADTQQIALMAVTQNGFLIEPEYVTYHSGDTVKDVLKKSSHTFSGIDSGVMENGFSLAWRCLDAQFWGVAQRRKRIFLVADFAGPLAPLLLFDVLDGRLDYAALRQRRPDDAVLSGGG